MVRTYIRKSERRITDREIVIQAVRKVISDKCEKSEVITEFGILFYLFIIILNYNILSPSFNAFYVLCNPVHSISILGRAAGPHSIYTQSRFRLCGAFKFRWEGRRLPTPGLGPSNPARGARWSSRSTLR